MYRITVIALVSALVLPAGAAQAQETARYRLEKTEDGYVRMDTDTGAMSICRERNEQLVCRLAADERTAFDDEVSSLQKRVDEMEKRIAALERGPAPKAGGDLPSDDEVDRTLGIMERFFDRFMGMVQDFDRKMRKEEPAQGETGRT